MSAFCSAGVTTVPLPTNIQAEDIVKIINEAELTCLVCSLGELPNLASLVGGCATVKTFVVMDLPSNVDPDTHALMKKVTSSLTMPSCRAHLQKRMSLRK